MIRNLKALGLALVTMLVIGAVVASSASAIGKFTTSSGPYPKHLIGEDVGAFDAIVIGSGQIGCHGETYTAQLTEATSTIEATPEYGNTCQTVGSGWNVTVTENGCKFHFEVVSTIATDEDKVTVSLKCPSVMELHHYTNSSHTTLACTNTIHSQMTDGTLTATSLTGSGDVLLEGTAKLSVTTHGACSFGFTLSQGAECVHDMTIRDTSGTRIHIA